MNNYTMTRNEYKNYNKIRMETLREKDFTNAQIARAIGCSYVTVVNAIGKQPKYMTYRSHYFASKKGMRHAAN